ncbi:MAG: ABC transporter substrate-binding protein [Chloroflexi bacterium]|nr:ABC transporter substrate-binding protein [Chloroflexota bacterium]
MKRRLTALLFVGIFAGACASTPAPSSEIGFSARSWPEASAAECAMSESGAARLGIARIEAVDELTVRFTLCAPDPAFTQKLAVTNFAVNDSGWLAAAITDGSLATLMNGTGPLELLAWEQGVQIVLTRNGAYWGDKAASERVVIQWEPESAARLLQLRAGTVDAADNLAPTDEAAIAADASLALLTRPGFNTFYLNFNNRYAPVSDVRVRQAIAMALDRQRIVDLFYPSGSTLATHVPPCVIEGACVGDAWYAQDLVAARALLTEAGYPNGIDLTLSLRETPRAYLPDPVAVATDIQAQLAAIGIRVTLKVEEAGGYIGKLLSGELESASFSAALPDYPEAWNSLGIDFGSTSGPAHGDQYPRLVALLDEAQRESDPAARAALFTQINNEIRSQVPVVPIANGASLIAARAVVNGLVASPVAMERFASVRVDGSDTFTWLQGGEPAGLYCMDEEDREAVRICAQVMEGLYGYAEGGTAAEPRLATGCAVSADGLVVECALRSGVRFHNGAQLDAGDVLDSFAAAWDCTHPLHIGRTGDFRGWSWIMGNADLTACQPAT